jgi:hypothetical protein
MVYYASHYEGPLHMLEITKKICYNWTRFGLNNLPHKIRHQDSEPLSHPHPAQSTSLPGLLDYSHEPQVTQPHLRPQEEAIGVNITTHSAVPFHTMPHFCHFPFTSTPFTTTQANGQTKSSGGPQKYRGSKAYLSNQIWMLPQQWI